MRAVAPRLNADRAVRALVFVLEKLHLQRLEEKIVKLRGVPRAGDYPSIDSGWLRREDGRLEVPEGAVQGEPDA